MLAVIENTASPGVPLLSIAGRPLVVRQLQWLRSSGFDQVALELPLGAAAEPVGRCVSESPLGWDVRPVQTRAPVGATELARRAGFPEDVPVLALPGDVLGECDLAEVYLVAAALAADRPLTRTCELGVQLPRPSFLPPGSPGGSLHLLRGSVPGGPAVLISGWGTRVGCAADAIALGGAILERRARGTALVVHASEREAGVWVARHGHIQPRAEIVPPVLVGPGAIIRAGARVGPRVFLGERAVVERGAVLSDTIIDPDTIVGEGLVAHEACLMPHALRSAARGGVRVEVDDALVLSDRQERRGPEGYAAALLLAGLAAALSAVGFGVFFSAP